MKRKTFSIIICLAVLMTLGLPALAGHRTRQPDRSVQVRVGGFFLDGEGDFWADNESVFTLDASDFDDFLFGVTYSHAFNRRLEFDLNADFTDETVVSEYQNFVDGSGFPILHDSSLSTAPITVGVRFLPFKREGNRPVLFLGAGAGVNFWRYEEIGDFIDFNDPANPLVFGDFSERGEAFVSYGAVGVELPLTPGFNIGLEGRYFKSDDQLRGDFSGLGTLNMDGWAASVSGNWRF